MNEIGNKQLADSYVHLRNEAIIYTENSVEYIKEQMKTQGDKIWLDIAAILREDVIPIYKEEIINYGEVIH